MSHADHPVILDESGWEAIAFLRRSGQITLAEYLDVVRSQAASLVYAQ